jgi:hypothetical protein
MIWRVDKAASSQGQLFRVRMAIGRYPPCLQIVAVQSGARWHPPFMILDSPREADMELGIFNRLIERLFAWHSAHAAPPFQLIVTTTTRPLGGDESSGTVRAVLGRQPSTDLLLGVEFRLVARDRR